jgi:hypothetical protein
MPDSGTVSVFGMYPDFRALRTSVDVLKSFGFRNEDISVLFPERTVVKNLSFERIERLSFELVEPLIGGTVGWLMRVEAANPGVVSDALTRIGVPNFTAQGYGTALRRGELLLSVRSLAAVAAERAEGILRRTGARHITSAWNPGTPIRPRNESLQVDDIAAAARFAH